MSVGRPVEGYHYLWSQVAARHEGAEAAGVQLSGRSHYVKAYATVPAGAAGAGVTSRHSAQPQRQQPQRQRRKQALPRQQPGQQRQTSGMPEAEEGDRVRGR